RGILTHGFGPFARLEHRERYRGARREAVAGTRKWIDDQRDAAAVYRRRKRGQAFHFPFDLLAGDDDRLLRLMLRHGRAAAIDEDVRAFLYREATKNLGRQREVGDPHSERLEECDVAGGAQRRR